MATTRGIHDLPDEVLLMVAGLFPLQRSHEDTRTNEGLLHESRSALQNLCKTSKQLGRVAFEALYKKISIKTPSKLVSLLCTVSQSDQLASFVKDISVVLVFEKNAKLEREFQQAWKKYSPGIDINNDKKVTPDTVRLFRLAGLTDPSRRAGLRPLPVALKVTLRRRLETRAGERIFATLLALVPNLKSVFFEPISSIARAPYDTMSSILDQVLADHHFGAIALQKLQTIRIQPKADEEDIWCDACVALFRAPTLIHFDGHHVVGGWAALPHTLRHVTLYEGSIQPDTFSILCDNPNLEVLKLKIIEMNNNGTRSRTRHDVFNAGLAKRASTLKTLQLNTGGGELKASYGPHQYLHSIRNLHLLERLTVELFALFCESGNLDPAMGWAPLHLLLPQSLQVLWIWESWNFPDDFYDDTYDSSEYRGRLEWMLARFAQECVSGRMPHLRYVGINFDTTIHTYNLSIPAVDFTSPAMRGLKTTFARAGVTLKLRTSPTGDIKNCLDMY